MIGLLALLFLVVPIAELYVIIQVSHGIGVPETILLLIAIGFLGAWLAKLAGVSVLYRIQQAVREGRVPSAELVDGALVLFAGALLLTPGFLSDCLAILLLLPPTRLPVRHAILRRIRAGGGFVRVVAGRRAGDFDSSSNPGIWDVEGWEDPPAPPDRPGLGR